jgi:hypothetical protein
MKVIPTTSKVRINKIYKDGMGISVGADGSGGYVPEIKEYCSHVKNKKIKK